MQVLRQLRGAMADADVLLVSGGAGVLALLETSAVREMLPPGARVHGVCDSCLLLAAPPFVGVAERPCSADATCPPASRPLLGKASLSCVPLLFPFIRLLSI